MRQLTPLMLTLVTIIMVLLISVPFFVPQSQSTFYDSRIGRNVDPETKSVTLFPMKERPSSLLITVNTSKFGYEEKTAIGANIQFSFLNLEFFPIFGKITVVVLLDETFPIYQSVVSYTNYFKSYYANRSMSKNETQMRMNEVIITSMTQDTKASYWFEFIGWRSGHSPQNPNDRGDQLRLVVFSSDVVSALTIRVYGGKR